MNTTSHLPITQKDLDAQRERVNGMLAKVAWKPQSVLPKAPPKPGEKLWRPSPNETASIDDAVSLLTTARTLSGDAALLTLDVNKVMNVLRDAISIGFHLSQAYGKATSLDVLMQQNRAGRLGQAQQTEFNGKLTMSAVVAIFTAASYVVFELGSYKEERVSAITVDFHGLPEVALREPVSAMQCLVYYLGKYLSDSGSVRTELEMVKMVLLYCHAVLSDIKARKDSLQYAEPFTQVSYQLVDSDFIVDGFESLHKTVATSVEFVRVEFTSIVGNRRAKHAANRIAKRLACYDLARKSNPFLELGGMEGVRMGYGKPGTGKTLLIGATATRVKDLCERRGIPFLFHPMPDNVVSTYQGGSAERMLDWMKRLQDDGRVIYSSIDDGENNLEDRTRQGVSAGVREVIGVFLRYTEGASAIKRGNTVLEVFTNIPEQIDKAVLSRVQGRFPINGAETRVDFMDQDYLWWRIFEKVNAGFVNMGNASGHSFMTDQAALQSLLEIEQRGDPTEFKDSRLKAIYEKVRQRHEPDDHAFFGELFAQVHKEFPFFTSRDVRNIQQAVTSRIMDFDIPDEWFDEPDRFFSRAFEERVEMLKELMRGNMKGLSFAELRLRESMEYLNNMVSIANADRERAIARYLEELEIRDEAMSRYQARNRVSA